MSESVGQDIAPGEAQQMDPQTDHGITVQDGGVVVDQDGTKIGLVGNRSSVVVGPDSGFVYDIDGHYVGKIDPATDRAEPGNQNGSGRDGAG